MEAKIVDYLKSQYNAEVILLHGSRARGNPHNSSDWDLLVFSENMHPPTGYKLEDQDLDLKFIQLPVTDIDSLIEQFPQSMQSLKLLLDNEKSLGARILEAAKAKYATEPGITPEKKQSIQHHFDRMTGRLNDSKDDLILFQYHLSQFYIKSIRYWFEYQGKWSQPITEALKIILAEDPEVHQNLESLASPDSPEAITAATQKIKAQILQK